MVLKMQMLNTGGGVNRTFSVYCRMDGYRHLSDNCQILFEATSLHCHGMLSQSAACRLSKAAVRWEYMLANVRSSAHFFEDHS